MKSEIILTLEEYNELIEGRDKIMEGRAYIISSYSGYNYNSETTLHYLDEGEVIIRLKKEIDALKNTIDSKKIIKELYKRKWWKL